MTIDGRTSPAKALNTIKEKIIAARGGDVSPMEMIVLDRVIFMIYKVTLFESQMLNGKDFSPDVEAYYLSWVNCLRRSLESLGLKRVCKDMGLIPVDPHVMAVREAEMEQNNLTKESNTDGDNKDT